MFHLMKINPSLSLVARTPMKSRVVEVPFQVPVGRFSFGNHRAGGDGTGELRLVGITEGGGWSLQGVGRGNECL